MKKIEIIEETAATYKCDADRAFSFKDGRNYCVYLNEEGKRCAVGRCFTPEALEKFGSFEGSIETLIDKTEGIDLKYEIAGEYIRDENFDKASKFLDTLLQEKYKGHNFQFWHDLQFWHDNDGHFEPNGITVKGLASLKDLKRTYKL